MAEKAVLKKLLLRNKIHNENWSHDKRLISTEEGQTSLHYIFTIYSTNSGRVVSFKLVDFWVFENVQNMLWSHRSAVGSIGLWFLKSSSTGSKKKIKKNYFHWIKINLSLLGPAFLVTIDLINVLRCQSLPVGPIGQKVKPVC